MTSHPPLPCFSTVPWKRGLWIIAEIYELNKELSTFVIEYSGACLSLLHCLEASVHSRFHFREREACVLLPPCLGTYWAVPQSRALPASPAHRSRGGPAGGAAVSTAAHGPVCCLNNTEGVSGSTLPSSLAFSLCLQPTLSPWLGCCCGGTGAGEVSKTGLPFA